VLRNCICRLATLNRIGYLAREQEACKKKKIKQKKIKKKKNKALRLTIEEILEVRSIKQSMNKSRTEYT